jgi:hypothetical protein
MKGGPWMFEYFGLVIWPWFDIFNSILTRWDLRYS